MAGQGAVCLFNVGFVFSGCRYLRVIGATGAGGGVMSMLVSPVSPVSCALSPASRMMTFGHLVPALVMGFRNSSVLVCRGLGGVSVVTCRSVAGLPVVSSPSSFWMF